MTRKKINKNLEDFKYLIDSRNLSQAEKRKERDAILKAREARFQERSYSEIQTAKLMQLKYQMEEYLNKSKRCLEPYFPKFLMTYVDTLYEKRKNFASDISVKPMTLSHVLNRHREPQEYFLHRLMLHSQDSFKELFEFDKELWPKVYYQDKMFQFMASSDKLEESEMKYVKAKKIKLSE